MDSKQADSFLGFTYLSLDALQQFLSVDIPKARDPSVRFPSLRLDDIRVVGVGSSHDGTKAVRATIRDYFSSRNGDVSGKIVYGKVLATMSDDHKGVVEAVRFRLDREIPLINPRSGGRRCNFAPETSISPCNTKVLALHNKDNFRLMFGAGTLSFSQDYFISEKGLDLMYSF
ncbi:MAG: hypothetical protein AABW73_00670 [Nanoarchaeota archaeon]